MLMNKTWQCYFIGGHPSAIELLREKMSSLAYALRATGKMILEGAGAMDIIMCGAPHLQKKKITCMSRNMNFWMSERESGEKNMDNGWIFDISQLGRHIPEVISRERRGRRWRRAGEKREETERGNRSGRLSVEEKRVILRVWPGGMLNNGWLRRRVARRGEVEDVITFFLSSSLLLSQFFCLFFSCPILSRIGTAAETCAAAVHYNIPASF